MKTDGHCIERCPEPDKVKSLPEGFCCLGFGDSVLSVEVTSRSFCCSCRRALVLLERLASAALCTSAVTTCCSPRPYCMYCASGASESCTTQIPAQPWAASLLQASGCPVASSFLSFFQLTRRCACTASASLAEPRCSADMKICIYWPLHGCSPNSIAVLVLCGKM